MLAQGQEQHQDDPIPPNDEDPGGNGGPGEAMDEEMPPADQAEDDAHPVPGKHLPLDAIHFSIFHICC